MENDYPEVCYAMIGLHPCSVDMDFRKALDEIEAWLDHRSFRGIGEVGTDLYWDKTYVEQQITCFNHQIDLAKSRQLPLVIHSRESLDMNIDLVAQKQDGSLRGVFHCFTGHREQAQRIIDLGFYMGIGGVVTFKNSGLGQIVRDLPMEAILLETDAPYLAPHPYRGKRNESAYIALIAQKVAECKEMELSAVAEITTANAKRLFRLN